MAAATVVGLVGCGGSKHDSNAAVKTAECQGCILPSPNRHHTVTQVEAAFAAQGLQLRKYTRFSIPGFTILLHGHKQPQLVTVLIGDPHADQSSWTHNQTAPYQGHLTTLYILGRNAGGHYSTHREGNVRVYFAPPNTQPVQAALSRLN